MLFGYNAGVMSISSPQSPPERAVGTANSSQDISALLSAAEAELAVSVWPGQEKTAQNCFERVLRAFQTHRVGAEHFAAVTGYGHDDLGRAVVDNVFADALEAEAALVRAQIVSGTHAIAIALRGCLQPGQVLLSVTGRPYDTLEEVIGLRGESPQSLIAQGINYREISVFYPDDDRAVNTHFTDTQTADIQQADVIFIQRSRGYSPRPSLSVAHLEVLIQQLRAIKPELAVMVDNCYGEFTEEQEPTAVGADLMAGSLIKNPGGGIVPAGGYVAGKRQWVQRAADALTCPGVGSKGGYTFELTRLVLQGLFLAPNVVKEALKGMTLAAKVFEDLGYDTAPHWQDPRSDIIQMIHLRDADKLVAFCQQLQKASPVESAVTPIPSEVPGYADLVVMAGGTFIEGSTLELSADGPLRAPYTAYLQGGLVYQHTRFALQAILNRLRG